MRDKKILDLTNLSSEETRRMNQIANEAQTEFSQCVDKLSQRFRDKEYWWLMPFSSRNNCLDNTFLYYAMLKLALEEAEHYKVRMIIVPSVFLKKAIKRNTKEKIKIVVLQNKKDLVKEKLPFICAVIMAVSYFRMVSGAIKGIHDSGRMGRKRMHHGEKGIILGEYVMDSEFTDGKFSDRYFNGLRENTDKKMIPWITLVYDDLRTAYKVAKKSMRQTDGVPFEAYVKRSDWLMVSKYIVSCFLMKVRNIKIGRMDVSDLVNGSFREGAFCINSYMGLLRTKAFNRFIEEESIDTDLLIEWYEAQPSSNYLVHQVQRKWNIPVVGYLSSPCPKYLLGYSPTCFQYKEWACPKFLGIQGRYWENKVKKFYDKVSCVKVPSFRYNGVFSMKPPDYSETNRAGILLALSGIVGQGEVLLRDFFQSVRGMAKLEITIKNHPSRQNCTLKDYKIPLSAMGKHDVKYVTGNMEDAVSDKKIVITSETTSAQEIVLSGAFTIVYVPQGKLENTDMPGDIPGVKIVYDAEEMKDAIVYFLGQENKAGDLECFREKIFTQVTRGSIERMFMVDGAMLC